MATYEAPKYGWQIKTESPSGVAGSNTKTYNYLNLADENDENGYTADQVEDFFAATAASLTGGTIADMKMIATYLVNRGD